MIPAPKRRWTFTLRTLFVVVTVAACWLAYEWNWIHQRRMLIADPKVRSSTYYITVAELVTGQKLTRQEYVSAPWPIRWMGEPGYAHILLGIGTSEDEAARVRLLFPDAEGIMVDEPE